MGDEPKNDPRSDAKRPDFGDLGERIRQDVHDEINWRMNRRREKWESRAARRQARAQGRGSGGVWTGDLGGGLIIGLVLAGIGVVLLLQNFGFLPDQDLWDYWPVIFIVVGVARASTAYSVTGRVWGGLVAIGGVLFLLAQLGYIHHNLFTLFWPVVLIGVGAMLLVRGIERNHYLNARESGALNNPAGSGSGPVPRSPDRVHEFAVFGGAHRRIDSQQFEGGDAVALFGGVQLNLRDAETKQEEMFIDITAAFGGVEIRVPETWAVSMRVTSIFGGYDDKTHAPPVGTTKPPLLVITGAVIFGGLSVKN